MMHSPDKPGRKVVVVGFDGCTFDVLKPLMKQGKLPHFTSLINTGVSGKLKSVIPPLSGPAWATFQTGLTPGKHGIYDFLRNVPKSYGSIPINSTFFSYKTLWEIISDQGKRVGVMNVLFSYPPKAVNGFIVSGKETPREDKAYSYPASLREEMLKFDPNYEIVPFKNIAPTKKFLRDAVGKIERQERMNNYLYKKYQCDFFMSYHAMPDIIHHMFWAHLDPSHPNHRPGKARKYLPLIEECYRTLDRVVGRKMELIDDDTVLIIMSDHGAGPVHNKIQINNWLQKQGLLALNQGQKNRGFHSFLSVLKRIADRLMDLGVEIDVFGLRRLIGYKTREKRRMLLGNALVDWSKTKAYTGRVSEYGIHINLKGREGKGIVEAGKEYEAVREFIIANLSEITDPNTGSKIFNKIWRREEVFSGPYLDLAPDLILDFGDAACLPGNGLLTPEVVEKVRTRGLGGMHRENGIFIVKGNNINHGQKIHGACIGDLAPTILYMMGLAVPKEMDGKVLYDIFDPKFVKDHPVRYDEKAYIAAEDASKKLVYTDDEAESIKERLKSLGYL
jgi:predicted AlkP superfamily phosphohydrolase/phosphomutase